MPQAREDGVPKFMGSSGEGSHRAWQLDFRAAAVRKHTGGAGIVLLSATPAKNSPLEFYNVLQFIDPSIFTRSGIHDPEQFIDRFLRIERRDVLDASFNVVQKSAVVGFKNMDDLRTIIYQLGEFKTAEDAQLKLPQPVPRIVHVTMDDEQEAKYTEFVAEIEDMLENPTPGGSSGNRILGLLARLSLVALHAQLDEGYTYKTALNGGTSQRAVPEEQEALWASKGWHTRSSADEDGYIIVEKTLPRPSYTSPKFVECARRVAASASCGHIIFCEPTATHQWIREILVEHGIPRERIAILNADATAPADRIRIAREFNGLASEPPAPGTCAKPADTSIAPLYDVVICNSVAYEGVDMQVRTCVIHHIDMTWTSADLEQRNGRAVRQGNTLGTVNIFYYFADRSMDGYRFDLVNGKATWLADLLKSQVRDTNNPAAQQQLSPEDILLMISRDKEKTQRLLDEKKAAKAAEARAQIAKEAARLLRQANGRFRDARASTTPERAARLREEGEERLAELSKISPEAWPWAPWMYAVRDTEFIVPEDGAPPLYEGLRVARPRPGAAGQLDYLEFGRIVMTSSGPRIGLRAGASPGREVVAGPGPLRLEPEHFPREGGPVWPSEDDEATALAIEQKLASTLRYGRGSLEELGWRGASDAWIDRYWPRFHEHIRRGLSQSSAIEAMPVVVDGNLTLETHADRGDLLAPSTTGWQRFLELAPQSGLAFTALKQAGEDWWERKIPQDLLGRGRPDTAADVEPPSPTEPATEVQVATPPMAEPKFEQAPTEAVTVEPASIELPGAASPEETWEDALVAEFAAQDPRDPQIRLERRLGSGARVFVATRTWRGADQNIGNIVVDDALDVEELAVLPEFQATLERRLEAALEVIRDKFLVENNDEETETGEGYETARKKALKDPPAPVLLDRLSQQLAARREEAALAELRAQARTDLTAASRIVLALAEPVGPSPTDTVEWFAEQRLYKSAALLSGFILTPVVPVAQFAADLSAALDAEMHARPARIVAGGVLKMWRTAIRHDGDKLYILEATGSGIRRHDVVLREDAGDSKFAHINARQAPKGPLRDGQGRVYTDGPVSDGNIAKVWERFDAIVRALAALPVQLADMRQLLLAAAALVDTPRCQGTAKYNALRALEAARTHYEDAKAQLQRGRDARAVDRLRQALLSVVQVAHSSAESCAAGQGALVSDEFVTPHRPGNKDRN